MKNRHIFQGFFTFLSNSYLKGFAKGSIFTGVTKYICVPGLNCYSCPGALGACPIGSLQAILGSAKAYFSYYVLGFMSLYGIIFGRFICGWLCPFGFIQDLLYKIPSKKRKSSQEFLLWGKYIVLGLTFLLPIFLVDSFGLAPPYFCSYICPSGTLFAGIPILGRNPSLQGQIGGLFFLKLSILLLVIGLSISISRIFCKTLCPLGAFYSLFQKVSFYQMDFIKEACIHCNKCVDICPMDIDIREDANQRECIRCLDCKKTCPTKAIESGFTVFINKEKLDSHNH